MPRESLKPGASMRSGSAMSPAKSALKSPIKLPLNDDKEEKSVRFKSRQALHEIQMNSLKAAVATPRKRQSLSQTGSPHTPGGDDKENGDRLDSVAGSAVTPMKRVPILANFEEWMKMATDNKINAANSWNFALIDYFHDMSLLREGDSVNFQKASCTLDGCVKIYTSRVDSVATETGKLLSGLADSNTKKKRGADDGEREEDEEEDEEEEGEDGVKKRKKKRVQRSSEATLASSFTQLQLKKMDLEFSVDPLFKKATADFDEGGAKGLLLNHLTIDSNGRIVFDSSDDVNETSTDEQSSAESQSPPDDGIKEEPDSAPIDMDSLASRFFPDLSKLDEQDICPSLKTFELGGAAETLDIPFLKAGDDWKKENDRSAGDDAAGIDAADVMMVADDDNDAGDIGGFDVVGDIGFGEGGEAWAREAAIEPQGRPFDASLDDGADLDGNGDPGTGGVGAYEADGAAYGVTLSQTHDPENILNYFDKALSKNWAGPEHWRIRKIKDTAAKPVASRQRKEKEPFEIDFSAPMSRSLADALYTPAASTSAISMPKAQWRSKTRNLLPDDKHFNSRQLLRLFLKPKARIGARRNGRSATGHQHETTRDDQHADLDPEFWAQRHAEAAEAAAEQDGALAAHGNYDADFFADDGLGGPGGDDDGEEFADAREAFSPGLDGVDGIGAVGVDGIDAAAAAGAEGGFGSQLVTQSRRLRPEYVQYARVAKKVDVRRLKEEMWKGMGFATAEVDTAMGEPGVATNPPETDKSEPLKFTSVMNGLQSVYPTQAMADISTSYCFICLLHLANEKGLVLQNEEQGRFEEIRIRRDLTADLSTGDV